MKRNENLGISRALLAVGLLTLLFVPSAWAASKTLYTFTVGNDGYNPIGGLILDRAGNRYGTTFQGGAFSSGTVFELTPNGDGTWTQSVLYGFTGGNDGAHPARSLIFDQTGNLYGTTVFGGPHNFGVAFKLAQNSSGGWHENVLVDFTNHPGADPNAELVFDTAGNLYGTTYGDNTQTHGSVFQITP
jgi:uncharacterized repeat protein (TIGR03803 family)